jgi:transposase-like protein
VGLSYPLTTISGMGGKPNYARRARAVELRKAGYSRSEIAKELGINSRSGALGRWLTGIPAVPGRTWRPNAKDDLREQAVKLRLEGYTYKEIRALVPVSKSTLSLWLRNLALTPDQQSVLDDRRATANERRNAAVRASHELRRAKVIAAARQEIGPLSEKELFIAGVAAYRAEGQKSKPWSPSRMVAFMNSDAGMIRLFLRWSALIGVSREDLTFRIAIHTSGDIAAAHRFWSEVVEVPVEQFAKPTLKRHKPKTLRKNVGSGYHGCLVIKVRRSTELNRRIAGWFQGIVDNLYQERHSRVV